MAHALLIVGLIALGVLVLVGAVVAVNVIQIGGKWKGQSLDELLGMPADQATLADLKRLTKAKLMQIFYAASPPDKSKMNGEINGTTVPVGVIYPFVHLFTLYIYGQGPWWIGKAFRLESSATSPEYNLFQYKNASSVQRKRLMITYCGKSGFDDKDSLHLSYSTHNTGLNKLIHDEVRMVNSQLYIGMGYFSLPFGRLLATPFALYGEFRPWVGPDAGN